MWLGWRRILSVLGKLIDVNVKLEEVLSYEVFDEAVIVNQLLVIDLCAALKLHFLRVELPFDLDLLERVAD